VCPRIFTRRRLLVSNTAQVLFNERALESMQGRSPDSSNKSTKMVVPSKRIGLPAFFYIFMVLLPADILYPSGRARGGSRPPPAFSANGQRPTTRPAKISRNVRILCTAKTRVECLCRAAINSCVWRGNRGK